MVDISTTKAPAWRPSAAPPVSNGAARTCRASGSIVMTTSACRVGRGDGDVTAVATVAIACVESEVEAGHAAPALEQLERHRRVHGAETDVGDVHDLGELPRATFGRSTNRSAVGRVVVGP